MNKNFIIGGMIAVIAVAGYFLLQTPSGKNEQANLPPQGAGGTAQITPSIEDEQLSAPAAIHTVAYTDTGYAPQTIYIKTGETVTFQNQSSRGLWTASDLHPSHRIYDGTPLEEHCASGAGTAFDACGSTAPSGQWQFTFTKAGNWEYHNHMNPTDRGIVVVRD